MTQDCTTKDLRCLMGLWLVIWIVCVATFFQDLQKQFSWERTTGTIVDIRISSAGRTTSHHPIITFQADSQTEPTTFMSEESHATTNSIGNSVEVVYNPKNPSKGPETLDCVKSEVAFSGCFGLFTTMLGVIMTVYFCLSDDSPGQVFGLREHLAPQRASFANIELQGVVI
mmetsp:Transcript_7270/g.11054  ORF Transcript_7270/g.11054 Transcript_7270/m.11054 type:complete len:171 (+) Transcript_7270:54-566(+)